MPAGWQGFRVVTARKHAPPPPPSWGARISARTPSIVKKLATVAFLFVLAGVLGTFSTQDAAKLYDGFAQHRSLISSDPFTVKGLILAALSFSLGVLLLIAKRPEPGEPWHVSDRALKWTGRYLLVFAGGTAVALFSSIPQYLIVDHLARQRGYVPCPTPTWPRHQNDRWALPGPHGAIERCPGEGTDPNL